MHNPLLNPARNNSGVRQISASLARPASRRLPQVGGKLKGLATTPLIKWKIPQRSDQVSYNLPALTSLPRLSAGIPTSYVVPTGLVEGATIALDLLDAGMLTDTEHELPTAMIDNSLRAWFESITAELSWFSPALYMSNNVENLDGNIDDNKAKEYFGLKSQKNISFGISFYSWEMFTLKEKVVALEEKFAGLGETALYHLERLIAPLCQAVIPSFTLYMCSHTYWHGEDTEEVALEEYVDCGGDPEDLDIIRRVDFDAVFPKMSYEAGEILDKAALENLLSHPDGQVSDLAALLIEEGDQIDYVKPIHLQATSDDYVPTLDAAMVIRWDNDDLTCQILDDYFQQESECGGTDIHNFWLFPQSSEGFQAAKLSIGLYIKQLKKVEQLMGFLATETK